MNQQQTVKQSPLKILVVDDDNVFRERLMRAFSDRGYDVLGAIDSTMALTIASEFKPDRITVDLRMPGDSGLILIAALKAQLKNVEIVLLTGYGSIATAIEAVKLGAIDYLTKPADADQILNAFKQVKTKEPASQQTTPSLGRVEWEHIQRVVQDCDNNISQAARVLGMHRRTLQRKLATTPPKI